MKILFFTHLTEEFPAYINSLRQTYKEHNFVAARTQEEYEREVEGSHILIYGRPSDEVLEKAKNLELIVVPFAGVAQLNRPLLKKLSIRASNSHGNAPVVAERALALAMACCGRVVEFHNHMAEGNWHRTGDPHKPFDYWFSLMGKKVSILGTGAIGSTLASLLKGFGCSIMGFKKSTGHPPAGFDSVTTDLEEALAHGEIIFAALPSTAETENLISRERMTWLKGKYIINVGRGSLLDEEAFFRALKSGEIAGAGIDAWYEYPSHKNPRATGSRFPFHELTNVVVSPHAASHAPEGKLGQLTGAIEVIQTYLDEGRVINEIRGAY